MRLTDSRAILFRLLLLVILLGGSLGCPRPSGPNDPGAIVDVPPSIEVTTENDPKERYRPPEFAGVLPSDFPADLPIYKPSSLMDFGETQRGYLVSMLSPDRLSKVRRMLHENLSSDGWSATHASPAKGKGESVVLRKDGRRVWLHLEDGRPGTVYRFEY
jgi:hypothetical protein